MLNKYFSLIENTPEYRELLKHRYSTKRVAKVIIDILMQKGRLPKEEKNRAYSTPEGTSCLIRTQNKIFIAYRGKYFYSSKDRVCIDDKTREMFFGTLREFNIKPDSQHNYSVYRNEHEKIYNYFSSLMDLLYRKQMEEEVQNG